MLPVESPYKTYTGLDGKPLNNGYVYFGLPDQNPITAPVTVYWDAAGTIPAAQPLRTVNGYITRAGTPANVFVSGSYSELVQNHSKVTVFYARNSDDFSIGSLFNNALKYSNNGTPVTFESGLDLLYKGIQNVRNVRFAGGAKGDGVTDDTAAIQAAMTAAAYGTMVYMPAGTYLVSATLNLTGACWLKGDGWNSTFIQRFGDYGDTIVCGTLAVPARTMRVSGIWFQHSTDWPGSGTVLKNRVTSGAHLRVNGAQDCIIEDCWFHRMRYNIYFDGGAWQIVQRCQFGGIWDDTNTALQEGVANVAFAMGTKPWGNANPTSWRVLDCEFLGATITRDLVYRPSNSPGGVVVPNSVCTIGAQYGLQIYGAEDYIIDGTYFGGQSICAVGVFNQVGSAIIGGRISNNFFDGVTYGYHILFAPVEANLYGFGTTITNNNFIGAKTSIYVNQNPTTSSISTYSLAITDNTFNAITGTPIRINGAGGFVISGNNIGNYNQFGVSDIDLEFICAILVNGEASRGIITNNVMGGGGNPLLNDGASNNCYVSVYIDPEVTDVVETNNLSIGIREYGTANFRVGMSVEGSQSYARVSPYITKMSDTVVLSNSTANASMSIVLPLLPCKGREVLVKDDKGNASSSPLAVGTNDGSLIDGVTSVLLTVNYSSRRFRFNGTQWNIIG